MKKKSYTICIIACLCIILASIVFIFTYVKRINVFKKFLETNTTFFENSYINEVDVSNLTPEEACEELIKDLKTKFVRVYLNDKEYCTIILENTQVKLGNVEAVEDFYFNQIMTMSEYYGKKQKREYKVDLEFEVLQYDLDDLDLTKKASDAYIDYNEKFFIVNEEYGSIKKENLTNALNAAIQNKTYRVFLTYEDCDKPSVYAKDLKECLDECNDIANLKLTYVLGDEQYTIEKGTLASFIKISKNTYEIDDAAVEYFVERLKRKYDTLDNHKFKTSDGCWIPVLDETSGDWIIDEKEEKESILKSLKNKENFSRSPFYESTGHGFITDEYGDSYIEISLAEQKVWYYKDGELLVETDCVTGQPSAGNTTPPGVFYMTNKKTKCVLRGPGYASPVDYWIPFNGGIGFHDASWQKQFGGDWYLTHGSHGCINLPLNAVKIIYENIDKDTPIILY